MSPGWVRDLAATAAAAGARFLEAPMIGSRPQADARALVHLVGGEVGELDTARPVLDVTAARVVHTGLVGTASTLKLLVNAMLATQVAAWAELLAGWASGGFPPNFGVDLVAKDLRYLCEMAGEIGGRTPMTGAALEAYRTLPADGHGAEDLTAVARSFLPPT